MSLKEVNSIINKEFETEITECINNYLDNSDSMTTGSLITEIVTAKLKADKKLVEAMTAKLTTLEVNNRRCDHGN